MGVKVLGKIKIYEIAKKLDLASKEIVEMAKKLNIEVKNHMSTVSEEEAQKIENKIKLILHEQISCQDLQNQIKY